MYMLINYISIIYIQKKKFRPSIGIIEEKQDKIEF